MEHENELTAEGLWGDVAGRLRGSLNDTTYGTWFGEVIGLELSADCFVLGVPNDFTRDWIEGHFRGLIGAAIRDVTGAERPIELRVTEFAGSLASEAEDGGSEPVRAPVVLAADPGTARERGLQREVHVRFLRDRLLEPIRACRSARGRRSAGAGVQPAASSTAAPGWGRRTCCRRSRTTSTSTPRT